jgi:hypothetical protein
MRNVGTFGVDENGRAPSGLTTRANVRMRHQGAEHFVVARKSAKADGAKGVRVVKPGSLSQPEMGGAQRTRQNRTVFHGKKFWKPTER